MVHFIDWDPSGLKLIHLVISISGKTNDGIKPIFSMRSSTKISPLSKFPGISDWELCWNYCCEDVLAKMFAYRALLELQMLSNLVQSVRDCLTNRFSCLKLTKWMVWASAFLCNMPWYPWAPMEAQLAWEALRTCSSGTFVKQQDRDVQLNWEWQT